MIENDEVKEILNLLLEECAEVIQAVSKINRFGFDSFHPSTPHKNNKDDLEEELGDLECVINLLKNKGVVLESAIRDYKRNKEDKIRAYTNISL